METILDMDQERPIKWTFAAIKAFEKRGLEILKRHGIKDQRGQLVADTFIDARRLLEFLPIADMTEAALGATTGLSSLEQKESLSPAGLAIEAYLGRGKSIEDLHTALWETFFEVKDPSALPIWKGQMELIGQERAAELEAKQIKTQLRALEIQGDREKLERLKSAAANSGKEPTK